MKYVLHNGYRIIGTENDSEFLKNSEVSNALQFLTAMEICETCIPNSKSDLKLGNYNYDINYQEKTIRVY